MPAQKRMGSSNTIDLLALTELALLTLVVNQLSYCDSFKLLPPKSKYIGFGEIKPSSIGNRFLEALQVHLREAL